MVRNEFHARCVRIWRCPMHTLPSKGSTLCARIFARLVHPNTQASLSSLLCWELFGERVKLLLQQLLELASLFALFGCWSIFVRLFFRLFSSYYFRSFTARPRRPDNLKLVIAVWWNFQFSSMRLLHVIRLWDSCYELCSFYGLCAF